VDLDAVGEEAEMGPDGAASGEKYQYCDLVMKGGITSGVIYPAAVAGLAREYRFKNIGGTSAGAIAASVAAAAELGRRSQVENAFDTLAALPGNLATDGHLLKLFTPDEQTRKVFDIALGVIGRRNLAGKIARTAWGVILASPFWFLLGLIPGMVAPTFVYSLMRWQSLWPVLTLFGRHELACVVSGLIFGVPLALGLALVRVSMTGVQAIADNGFGLCSGLASRSGPTESLTGWIHQQIQKAAGRESGEPVTFGDLWSAPAYPGELLATERTINLEVVTTGLTEGRPFTIPFLDGAFYFNPAELKALLPEEVLSFLMREGEKEEQERHPIAVGVEPRGDQRGVVAPDGRTRLCRLPGNERLPILVATRMSLSFPGLLSAVPLYRVDYRLERNQSRPDKDDVDDTRMGTRVWFSDGGICSNFPLNFFDSPLPRWPTFGLNLQEASEATCQGDRSNAAHFVSLPKPAGRAPVVWNWLGDGNSRAVDRVTKFAGAIINTMQNWQDNLQARAPGFRDRIVSVRLCADEGGLNLNMPEALITDLSKRGAEAAKLLLTEFDFSQHAFTRFRVSLGALQDYLNRLEESYLHPLEQDAQGWAYINGNGKARPKHYDWGHRNVRDQAAKAVQDVIDLCQAWQASLNEPEGFSTGSPRPRTPLEGRPDF
jgi:predicted acylesterase/phospholipase RssA